MAELAMTQADYEQLCAQAIGEYGDGECCGMMTFGGQDGPVRVHACENIQDKMHQQDPVADPGADPGGLLDRPGRTASHYFPGRERRWGYRRVLSFSRRLRRLLF